MIIKTAKLKLANMLKIALASVQTDKGELYYEGDLVIEKDVYSKGPDGNYILPEDGEYKAGDKMIKVVNGVIEFISDSSSPEDSQTNLSAKPKKGKEKGREKEPAAREYVTVDKFNELLAIVNDLVTEVNSAKSVNEELKTKLTTALRESNGKPVPPSTTVNPSGNTSIEERFFGVK